MQLEIVTPEKKAFSDEIESVVVPGVQGELGILKAHSPLISSLQPGELRYMKNGEETSMAIGTGIIEVSHDTVSILTDMAMGVSEIDESAVEKALERAKESLKEMTTPEEIATVQVAIQKSMAQLHIKRRRRHL